MVKVIEKILCSLIKNLIKNYISTQKNEKIRMFGLAVMASTILKNRISRKTFLKYSKFQLKRPVATCGHV